PQPFGLGRRPIRTPAGSSGRTGPPRKARADEAVPGICHCTGPQRDREGRVQRMPGYFVRHVKMWGCGVVLVARLVAATSLRAQVAPDQPADLLLNTARKAYNDKNYPFAAARFREFLTRFGNHTHTPAARYGLALALLDGPERDYAGAREQL